MEFKCKYCGKIIDLVDAENNEWIGRDKDDDTGYRCDVSPNGDCYPDVPKKIIEAYRKAIIDYHEKKKELLKEITIEYNQKMKEIERQLNEVNKDGNNK
jgi:hypothetical protein